MAISHTGQSYTPTSSHSFSLNNILHVPKNTRNLLPVHCFTTDNNVFFEFHPTYFLVKDQHTKTPPLQGRCRQGLYHMPSPKRPSSRSHVLIGVKVSQDLWHCRLGHPSSSIIHHVLKENKNLVSTNKGIVNICNACQFGKSHQLPFPIYSSVSSSPLELIFFMYGAMPLPLSVEISIK